MEAVEPAAALVVPVHFGDTVVAEWLVAALAAATLAFADIGEFLGSNGGFKRHWHSLSALEPIAPAVGC